MTLRKGIGHLHTVSTYVRTLHTIRYLTFTLAFTSTKSQQYTRPIRYSPNTDARIVDVLTDARSFIHKFMAKNTPNTHA